MNFQPDASGTCMEFTETPFDESALWASVGDYQGECFLLRTAEIASARSKLLGTEVKLGGPFRCSFNQNTFAG